MVDVKGGISCALVIVNYNGAEYLARCLESVAKLTVKPGKVVVADNGSTDGSAAAALSVSGLNVELMEMGANLGFAAANNRVIESLSSYEWIALLNPDAFPEPDWLECLMAATLAHPDVDSFSSRMMLDSDASKLDGAGDVLHFTGLAWRRGHGRSLTAVDLLPREAFSPCGGAALYRRSTFITAGGFDEDFFCYLEDVDLGFRLQLMGHRCMYIPSAVVRHVGSAITGLNSDFSIYHGHRNLSLMYLKNMPFLLFWLFLPFHVVMVFLVGSLFVRRGRGRIFIKAKFDAALGVGKTLKKRCYIQKRRRIGYGRLLSLLNFGIFRN